MSQIVFPTGTPGFAVSRKLRKLGNKSSDTAELSFQDVFVPDENVLGEVNKGFYNIMWELQGERLIGAAGSLAGAGPLLWNTRTTPSVFDVRLTTANRLPSSGLDWPVVAS